MFYGIEYTELHVGCDWCDETATALIYSILAVQHACDAHLGDWLRGQAYAVDPDDEEARIT